MSLPALILIHGYPFDHTLWKSVVLALNHETKIVTPDLPGFGDNPTESAEPSIDLMADDIAELMDFHNTRRAVIAGMSMGGYVALAFAERHPERLAGLGLVSTQAGADSEEGRNARRSLIEKVRHGGTRVALDALLPKMFSAGNEQNPELARFAIEGAENAGVDGICWALEAMARRPDRNFVLKKMSVPVAVIHGVEDKIVPLERARQMAELTPNAKFTELKNAGHASPLEAPDEVAAALSDLVRRSEKFVHGNEILPKREEPGIIVSPTEHGL
jgi:pimeloyl-ACP methyl ester carboxylesterase